MQDANSGHTGSSLLLSDYYYRSPDGNRQTRASPMVGSEPLDVVTSVWMKRRGPQHAGKRATLYLLRFFAGEFVPCPKTVRQLRSGEARREKENRGRGFHGPWRRLRRTSSGLGTASRECKLAAGSCSACRTRSVVDSLPRCDGVEECPFLELELFRRLSKLLVNVLATFPPADVRFRRMLPLASTCAGATVLLPRPGVAGAPGFSSVASNRYQRRPSDSSNGFSSSNEVPSLTSPMDRRSGLAPFMDLERSTTRSSILVMRASSQSRVCSLWASYSRRK